MSHRSSRCRVGGNESCGPLRSRLYPCDAFSRHAGRQRGRYGNRGGLARTVLVVLDAPQTSHGSCDPDLRQPLGQYQSGLRTTQLFLLGMSTYHATSSSRHGFKHPLMASRAESRYFADRKSSNYGLNKFRGCLLRDTASRITERSLIIASVATCLVAFLFVNLPPASSRIASYPIHSRYLVHCSPLPD
jgi:hypothetical protein